MNQTELLSFLERIGRRPNRGLSQNFLIDQNVVTKIVETADIRPGDSVLEIGPGPGALTIGLLQAGATVFAIEKDPIFAREIERFQTKDRRLHSFEADILEFPFSELRKTLKVVANLPYHITTPILEKLFTHRDLFESVTIMVQTELADRICAPADTKNFGSLSLFINFHATIASAFKVAASCFYPKPQVDSKVLHLLLRSPPIEESSRFFSLVRKAFQQRRKMIRTSLHSLYPSKQIEQALISSGARTDARPESLDLAKWVLFYTELNRPQ